MSANNISRRFILKLLLFQNFTESEIGCSLLTPQNQRQEKRRAFEVIDLTSQATQNQEPKKIECIDLNTQGEEVRVINRGK